jgi:hypothetical protein
LTARVQFSGISSFSFVLFSYVLLPHVLRFLHSVHSVLILRILYSVLLMYSYYCLRIVHCLVTLPPGIGPIAVGHIYIYIYIREPGPPGWGRFTIPPP